MIYAGLQALETLNSMFVAMKPLNSAQILELEVSEAAA